MTTSCKTSLAATLFLIVGLMLVFHKYLFVDPSVDKGSFFISTLAICSFFLAFSVLGLIQTNLKKLGVAAGTFFATGGLSILGIIVAFGFTMFS